MLPTSFKTRNGKNKRMCVFVMYLRETVKLRQIKREIKMVVRLQGLGGMGPDRGTHRFFTSDVNLKWSTLIISC